MRAKYCLPAGAGAAGTNGAGAAGAGTNGPIPQGSFTCGCKAYETSSQSSVDAIDS